jgi:hypothetical protein
VHVDRLVRSAVYGGYGISEDEGVVGVIAQRRNLIFLCLWKQFMQHLIGEILCTLCTAVSVVHI